MPVTIQELQQESRISIRAFLRALLIEPADNTTLQFFRYTIVGGVALTADFSTLFLLTRFAGIHYLASAAVAFLVGLTVNYALSRSGSSPGTRFKIVLSSLESSLQSE